MIASLPENVVLTIVVPSSIVLGAVGLWAVERYRRRKNGPPTRRRGDKKKP